MDHLFLDCVVSSRVLECAIQQGWISNRILAITTNLCNRLQGIASHPSLRRELPRIFLLLWHIWKGRNGVVFRNEIFKPMLCLVSAKKAFTEWRIRSSLSIHDYLTGAPSTSSSPKNIFVRWFPPQPGIVKLNFDGSGINSAAAGGFILRDWTGKILKAGAANYGQASSLVAEARALKDGVLLATQEGFSTISIEGDNLIVIQFLKGECHGSWHIAHIIQDVSASLTHVTSVSINHIFREAKMAADWLSKFGHSITESFITDFGFSPMLRQIVAIACIGRTLVRRDD